MGAVWVLREGKHLGRPFFRSQDPSKENVCVASHPKPKLALAFCLICSNASFFWVVEEHSNLGFESEPFRFHWHFPAKVMEQQSSSGVLADYIERCKAGKSQAS